MEETTIKMYDSVLDLINREIKHSKKDKETENYTVRDKHYYVQGLEAAKQLIESEQDFVYSDYAYEKFEEIVQSFLDDQVNQSTSLYPEDIKQIVDEQVDGLFE